MSNTTQTRAARQRKSLTQPMRSILSDFNRAPIRSKHEYSDGNGMVLKPLLSVGHYDGRTLGALMSRGLLDFFTRCKCGVPCVCECNGYHITESGKNALQAVRS